METLTAKQVKERLVERGLTVKTLAERAGIEDSNVYALLNGKQYLGPVRRARLEQAIADLRLAEPAEPAATPDGPVFNIRQL